ncbi:DUF4328 domain-containing protein [Streptomyces sp. NBC_00365]|uniref:DUF4328 domain-containing protein n=1 Tax=Streptomyces sp. NBC_00365 TaxID=2975726 RepID=UPI002259EB99|nr:DUF4328 domain-containing protein [Streptomyces sp. NBC_00365]MCX5092400.1 DUF4328 domain-containing protein [Streptomyces sp. NBC_00365]
MSSTPIPVPGGAMAPPHGAARLRSPVGLGRAVAVLLGVVVAVDLLAIWAGVRVYDVTGTILDGGAGEALRRDTVHADSVMAAVGVVQLVSLAATVVVYLVWFYRVRINAEVFDPFGHEMGRAWTGWGWFVPLVNLWFPRRIMLNTWDASRPVGSRTSHGLVNAWWAMWITTLVVGRAGFVSYRGAETVVDLYGAAGEVLFADVTGLVAAVLAVLVVLRLTRMQNEKALRGPVPPGEPVPAPVRDHG